MTDVYDVIIDTDPGVDDTFALLYALANPSFNVLGIVSVSGNVNIEATTRNARGFIGLAKREDIKIGKGSNTPLVNRPFFADDVHGANGLGGYDYKDEQLAPLDYENGIDLYVDLLEKATQPLHIIALGPLTNLAILLRAYPKLKEKISQITSMGGSIGHGNATPAAEFNYYVDPHAARVIFEAGIPLVMAGLHVTEQATLREEDLKTLEDTNSQVANFLLDISRDNMDQMEAAGFGRFTVPHDVMPFMYLSRPDIFQAEDMTVHVNVDSEFEGMTLADTRPRSKNRKNAQVITHVDVDAYRKEFLKVAEGFIL